MARPNNYSLVFGLSAIELIQSGRSYGLTDITGSFSVDINPNIVRTVGGASSYTRFARLGRSEGAGSITLNERPTWIEELSGGTPADTAASATATFGAVEDAYKAGNTNSLASLTFAAETGTGANPIIDAYTFEVEATAAAIVQVRRVGSAGVEETSNITLSATATPIDNTGVTITAGASPNFTVGDIVRVKITPPHGGVRSIGVPQVRAASEFEVHTFSNRGGDADVIEKLVFPRVLIVGAPISRTDVAIDAVEIPIEVMAPSGNGDVVTRELIRRED